MENKDEDKYLWLEDVLGEKSLEWARACNKKTVAMFENETWFQDDVNNLQKILEAKDKIPAVYFIDSAMVYNLWTDEKNLQGLFRRTTIEDYKNVSPKWETILDLDQQSLIDGQKWVYHGFNISPNKSRALFFLSPGGSDADIAREFDLNTKTFIKDGFDFPLAKGDIDWLSDDEVFISRDCGPGTVTNSGYSRQVRRLKRGVALENATIIFEIPKEENSAFADAYHHDGKSIFFVGRRMDFYNCEISIYENDSMKKLDLPKRFDSTGSSLTGFNFVLNEDWKGFLMGDLIHFDYATETPELIFRADANSSIYSARTIKSGLFLIVDTDVKGNFYYVTKENGKWTKERLDLPENGSLDSLITTTKSDDFFINFNSFNTPVSYYYGVKNKVEAVVKRQVSHFDFENIEVSQHFTKSPDGTKVPYFLVHKKGLVHDGSNPTILYGYGGFEVPLKPYFSNVLGKGWLDKGGVYVLANIRGGGEYGPKWHQCALKENRQRAYDDFYAIAEDIIAKKITSPAHLGAQGGSNGGLLMGVCFTQRPELFKAINCGVPLLDMRRYHKLLAGYSWVAEYGNPDEADGAFISKISPYHNINKEQKNYPMMFLNTSTKDDRVHPGHARKFAATLEEYGINYIYHENIDGGHAGASNLKELAFMKALDYAFFWKYLK